MRRFSKYFAEVKTELAKVTWPKRAEVTKLTLIVVVISVVVGSYIGALDFTFVKILETVINQ